MPPTMTAEDTTPDTRENVTEESTTTNTGERRVNCGTTDVPDTVAELFGIAEGSEIEVRGYGDDDTEVVHMHIHTDSTEPRLSVKQVLGPAQAREIGGRLIEAANVADGDANE